MNSSYGYNLLNLGTLLLWRLIGALFCYNQYSILESNQYKTLTFRKKNFNPKRTCGYYPIVLAVMGIPNHRLYQRKRSSTFKYISAEIGAAILSFRCVYIIKSWEGEVDVLFILLFLVKLFFLTVFITYWSIWIHFWGNIYILVIF